MKRWLWLSISLVLIVCTACSSRSSEFTGVSLAEPNGSESVNQDNKESKDVPSWAQVYEKGGQLFTGLNLDGNGDSDDEAYVSCAFWNSNGTDPYDAAEIVVRIRFGTGDTTAIILPRVRDYKLYTARLFSEKKDAIVLEVTDPRSNSGMVSVFVLDVYGPVGAGVVVRLDTTTETPVLSVDGKELYTGSVVAETSIADIKDKPLQGIVLHSTGHNSSPPRDTVSSTIYWDGTGWILLARVETDS